MHGKLIVHQLSNEINLASLTIVNHFDLNNFNSNCLNHRLAKVFLEITTTILDFGNPDCETN